MSDGCSSVRNWPSFDIQEQTVPYSNWLFDRLETGIPGRSRGVKCALYHRLAWIVML
jgi:hypothetical protein